MPYMSTTKRLLSPTLEHELAKHLIVPKGEAAKTLKTRRRRSPSPIPSTSWEMVYETPKQGFIPRIEFDVNDDSVKKEEEDETYIKK